MFSIHKNRSRGKGFTLVELLVVMTIMGILMGLMMAAITNARTAAQRAVCVNNQGNIAKAIIGFTTTKNYLPYSERLKGKNSRHYTWRAGILEQMNMKNLADQYDSGELGSESIAAKEFRCPSGDGSQFQSNYFANCGRTDVSKEKLTETPEFAKSSTGLFFRYNDNKNQASYKSSLSSITDGLSNTILISEGIGTSKVGFLDWWQADSGDDSRYYGIMWNSNSGMKNADAALDREFPSSRHPNAHVATFADSSVRPLSRGLQYATYQCLMAPSDAKCNLKWANDPAYE